MALPQDTPTLESCNTGNWTWPDNVWRNTDAPSPFISCSVNPALQPAHTNHLPIISVINLTYTLCKQDIRFNYKNVDWKTYNESLKNNLTEVATLLNRPIELTQTIKITTNLLFEAINKTTGEVVPLIKITPHMKRWWTKELMILHKSRNRAGTEHYRWHSLPDHPSHLNYQMENRAFTVAIEKAKAEHWKEWINHASGEDIWAIHRYSEQKN